MGYLFSFDFANRFLVISCPDPILFSEGCVGIIFSFIICVYSDHYFFRVPVANEERRQLRPSMKAHQKPNVYVF
jgi:hypothetical protein